MSKIDKAAFAAILKADRGAVEEALAHRGGSITEAPGYDREKYEMYALREVCQHVDGNYVNTYGWARIIRNEDGDIDCVKFTWTV